MRATVLIGYDDTPEGEDALGLGRRISEILDASPLVATIIPQPRDGADPSEFDKAREHLDGLDVQQKVLANDSPAAGIYELTDWLEPTAIVIGSTRHGTSR